MAIRFLAAALLVAMLAGSGLAAEPARAPTVKAPNPPGPPKVSVTLLGETASIEPGASFWVGIRQRIAPGWHTYWTNPGDSGEPPTVDWALPAGWTAGPLVFPQPERMPVGPLMSFGYTKEVVLLTRLTAPAGLATMWRTSPLRYWPVTTGIASPRASHNSVATSRIEIGLPEHTLAGLKPSRFALTAKTLAAAMSST